jgi:hypothetical protein
VFKIAIGSQGNCKIPRTFFKQKLKSLDMILPFPRSSIAISNTPNESMSYLLSTVAKLAPISYWKVVEEDIT